VRLLPRRGPTIDKLREAGDIESLRALLDHADAPEDADDGAWDRRAPVRAEAAAALATLDGPGVKEGLAHALWDPNREVRTAALDGMAARSSPVAVGPLLGALAEWPYPAEYAAMEKALEILVRWAPEGGAEGFVQGISHPAAPELDKCHRDVLTALVAADPRGEEAAAARIADNLAGQLAESEGEEHAARIGELLAWLGPPAGDSILTALAGDSPSPGVVRLAGQLRDARAVDRLVALLGASDAATRAEAAAALGHLNDTRAVQALIGATQDPEQEVRDAASDALDEMGIAAVIIGVASVLRETVREQLAAGADPTAATPLPAASSDHAPPAEPLPPADALPAAPPTWTQEVLTRLLRRAGKQA
jgi:HEAT repeat protein